MHDFYNRIYLSFSAATKKYIPRTRSLHWSLQREGGEMQQKHIDFGTYWNILIRDPHNFVRLVSARMIGLTFSQVLWFGIFYLPVE